MSISAAAYTPAAAAESRLGYYLPLRDFTVKHSLTQQHYLLTIRRYRQNEIKRLGPIQQLAASSMM